MGIARPFRPACGLMLVSILMGAPPDQEEFPTPEQLQREFAQPIPGVDWDQLSPHFVTMLERMFERNGWTEETDRFAQKLATKIAAFPPWDLAGRFNALNEEVAGRYGLTTDQSRAFQAAVLREATGMLMRHGPAMWEQAREALQGRAQGKPYTAEQIARWTKDAEPLLREIEGSANSIAEELGRTLPDDKRSVLEKDMASFQKRQKALEAMSRRWAEGLWQPGEWGLEDDPVQKRAVGAAPALIPAAPAAPATAAKPTAPLVVPVVERAPIPDHWIDHDPATWIALVLDVRKRYGLDAGQMDTAWSIHGELVERAARYAKLRSDELSAVPVAQRSTHEAYHPIRQLFVELRDRLDAIPTSSQRVDAKPLGS